MAKKKFRRFPSVFGVFHYLSRSEEKISGSGPEIIWASLRDRRHILDKLASSTWQGRGTLAARLSAGNRSTPSAAAVRQHPRAARAASMTQSHPATSPPGGASAVKYRSQLGIRLERVSGGLVWVSVR